MKKVRLRLSKLNIAGLVELGLRMNKQMTGNSNFTTPPADLADAKTNADGLQAEANLGKATNSKKAWADARVFKAKLKVNLRALANYIDEIAKGDEVIILSAGVPVNKAPEKAPAPNQVKNVDAEFTNKAGKILLMWGSAVYAHFYEVYMSTTPDKADSWVLINTIKGRQMLVDNLVTGTRYWFRVVAKGLGDLEAPPSDAASQLAA